MAATAFAALLLSGCASRDAAPPASGTAHGTAAAPEPSASAFGVLVMAHGGTPEWNEAVLVAVKPLKARYAIEVAFGMADAATLQEGVRKLEAQNVRKIGVVRLFVSGESWFEQTEQIFGLRPGAPERAGSDHAGHAGAGHAHAAHAGHAGAEHAAHAGAGHAGHGEHSMEFFRVATGASFALTTEGLADAQEIGAVLADRASALSKTPAREDVLILAHGPGDDAENERWLTKLDALAGAVRARAPFRRVQVETLREDWPEKRVAAEKRIRAFVERASQEDGKAIVIPFRVQGFGPYAEVLQGLDYVADRKGLIPHAAVSTWIERQIAALESGAFRAPLPR
ncbi:MAG: hypothetical protein KF782_24055 [Labilithrix sp.]|nr:hypothetical protein [Labilithrix sp.]